LSSWAKSRGEANGIIFSGALWICDQLFEAKDIEATKFGVLRINSPASFALAGETPSCV
jgi:hypothetical protein